MAGLLLPVLNTYGVQYRFTAFSTIYSVLKPMSSYNVNNKFEDRIMRRHDIVRETIHSRRHAACGLESTVCALFVVVVVGSLRTACSNEAYCSPVL